MHGQGCLVLTCRRNSLELSGMGGNYTIYYQPLEHGNPETHSQFLGGGAVFPVPYVGFQFSFGEGIPACCGGG